MRDNLTQKIIRSHLAKPAAMIPGEEVYVKVDQTITHDISCDNGIFTGVDTGLVKYHFELGAGKDNFEWE